MRNGFAIILQKRTPSLDGSGPVAAHRKTVKPLFGRSCGGSATMAAPLRERSTQREEDSCLPLWLPKILSGSFRARTGHWPARTAGLRGWRGYFRKPTRRWRLHSLASRVHSAGRPGPGRRLRYWKNQSHEQNVRGSLGLRHHSSKWQIDVRSGVCRYTSTGTGLRVRCKPQSLTLPERCCRRDLTSRSRCFLFMQ